MQFVFKIQILIFRVQYHLGQLFSNCISSHISISNGMENKNIMTIKTTKRPTFLSPPLLFFFLRNSVFSVKYNILVRLMSILKYVNSVSQDFLLIMPLLFTKDLSNTEQSVL